MKDQINYFNANFMDFIDQPKAFTPKKAGKKRQAVQDSPFLSGNFMDMGGSFDIGLDLGKVANQGISLNYGKELGLSSPISNKGWGFEEYIARDFSRGSGYGKNKTPKSERKLRTIEYNESPELYGMESLAIYSGKSETNLKKSGKAFGKTINDRTQQVRQRYNEEGTLLDYGRKKLAERKMKKLSSKQNSGDQFGSEPEKYDDYEDYDERKKYYSKEENYDANPESPVQKTRREYFPDYDEGIGQRGSSNEPYEGEIRIQRNKRGVKEGIKRRFRW